GIGRQCDIRKWHRSEACVGRQWRSGSRRRARRTRAGSDRIVVVATAGGEQEHGRYREGQSAPWTWVYGLHEESPEQNHWKRMVSPPPGDHSRRAQICVPGSLPFHPWVVLPHRGNRVVLLQRPCRPGADKPATNRFWRDRSRGLIG